MYEEQDSSIQSMSFHNLPPNSPASVRDDE